MDEFPVFQVPEGELLEEEEFERLYSAPAEIIVLLSIFYGSISILAVIGNTLVIWVVATTRQMRTVTNMYIANLAFADVIIGLFCIPFQFQAALLQRWNLPWFMCGFCPFVQALSVNVSVFTLTAIAIDRHRAIINPLRARPTKFISKIIIGSIWLVSLAFAIPCAIAFRVELEHDRYREDGIIYNVTRPFCLNKNLSDQQLQIYRYTLVFVQYLVPFLVISFVYIQMAVKLWGTRAPGNAQDSRDITLLKNKKKVIKMLIIVVIVFGLCWLPLQLYNILYVTIPEINEYHFISIVWFCCDWLAMSNSCYNPFIYGIYNEKFKREFNKRFAACFCKFQTSLDAQERNASMHTRASSIRSTYANSSMRIRNNLFNNSAGVGGTNFQTPLGFSHNGSCYRQKSAALCGGINSNGGLISGKNSFQGSPMPYNIITGYTHTHHNNINGCNNNNGTSGTGNYVSHWRRNNFKPLHPDVIEQEGDDDAITLMAMHSSTPPSEEISTGDRRVLTTTLSDEEESSSCICEQELGSRTECDGTCILSEVSRVHKPPTCATTPLLQTQTILLPTATTTSTISSDNNNFKLDFNYVDNAIAADMEMREYAPLHKDDDAANVAEQQQQKHSRATTMRTTPS